MDLTPWARTEASRNADRFLALEDRARSLRAHVSIGGKSAHGPWAVKVGNSKRLLHITGRDMLDELAFALDRWEAGADDTGIRWTARQYGLAHGHKGLRPPRTLCGQVAISEKEAWPPTARCHQCWIALDKPIAVAA